MMNKSLRRYFLALASLYPNEVRIKDIAEVVGVSPSAVTQQRENIVRICDENIIINKNRFKLKKDIKLLGNFVTSALFEGNIDQVKEVVETEYFKEVLREVIYVIDNKLKLSEYFDKEDLEFVLETVILTVKNMPNDIPILIYISRIKFDNIMKSLIMDKVVWEIIEVFIDNLVFPDDVDRFKKFRNHLEKFLFNYITPFIINKAKEEIDNMEIMKNLDEENRKIYRQVYIDTIIFYVNKILRSVVEELDKKMKIPVKQ